MYPNKEDEVRKQKLMYKAFELNLTKPMDSQIAKTILFDEKCSEIQSENNRSFLSEMQAVVVSFLRQNELDYNKDNSFKGNPDCECDFNCECSLNEFVMPAFKNMAIEFGTYIENNSIVNTALKKYTTEEQNRLLNCNLREALRLILYKGLAYLAFDLGFYDVSCWHHEAAVLMYGGSIVGESFNPSEYVENELSARNKKASDARWQPHREVKKERKKKYLKIMKDKGFSTYTDAASYIKQHIDTGKKPSFPTVCRLLSEADKGDFS